ncbi:MAG TPA: cytochrome c3 family protein [Coriobacteriia bacterium]|nr:cytochrome c3 family protein [Coriobacteriia bacterium]
MKRFVLVLTLVLALSLAVVGSAYANFGPHGGYIDDTDSCAGCHRAHSSFSSVTFTPRITPPGWDPADNPSALLVGDAATMQEFCDACHGDNAPGASTNVVEGIFDGGPSSYAGQVGPTNDGVTTAYVTSSTFGAPLNGGGFSTMYKGTLGEWEVDAAPALTGVTSTHSMEKTGILWGAGNTTTGNSLYLTCTSCHDPHGSSNYRLLKDSVNNTAVGGYNPDGTPNGMVYSTETNYPYSDNGWLKHADGQAQMQAYVPNYTSGSSQIRSSMDNPYVGGVGSLSTWCAACHEQYDNQTGNYDYGTNEGAGLVGSQPRHRHPVDITLVQGDDVLQVAAQADGNLDQHVPLEVTPGAASNRQNQVGCLTCHYAHGSAAVMNGWAAASLTQNAEGTWVPVRDGIAGVDPDKDDDPATAGLQGTSALLRADNRGVCERCHDK